MPDRIKGYRQFAALPYRFKPNGEIEVLFVTSRGTRQWIVPKGKPEKHKGKPVPPWQIAATEAAEEGGVTGRVDRKPIGGFMYDKIEPKRTYRCRMQVYLLKVSQQLTQWKEQGEREIEWLSIDDAIIRLIANTNIPERRNKRAKLTALFAKAKDRMMKKESARAKRAHKQSPPMPVGPRAAVR